MSVKDELVRARAVIDTPDKWTQGAFARTKAGNAIGTDCPAAICFCTEGALLKVSYSEAAYKCLEDAILGSGYPCDLSLNVIVSFNDAPGRTHAEIIEMFDRAIEAAQ